MLSDRHQGIGPDVTHQPLVVVGVFPVHCRRTGLRGVTFPCGFGGKNCYGMVSKRTGVAYKLPSALNFTGGIEASVYSY